MRTWINPRDVARMVTPMDSWGLCMRIPPRDGISVLDISALDLSNKTQRRELVLLLAVGARPCDREGRPLPATDYAPGRIYCVRGFLRYGQEVGKILSAPGSRNRPDDLSMLHLTDLEGEVTWGDTIDGVEPASWGEGVAGAEHTVFGSDADIDAASIHAAVLYGACVLRRIQQLSSEDGSVLDAGQRAYLYRAEALCVALLVCGNPDASSDLADAVRMYREMRR